MANSIRLISEAGKTLFITPQYKKFLLRAELATIANMRPLILKLKDDAYCPEFLEEQRYLRGRLVRVTRGSRPRNDRKIHYSVDQKGVFRIKSIEADPIVRGSSNGKRIRPPRKNIPQSEIDFQRHKTALLRKQSEEEAERVRLRSG